MEEYQMKNMIPPQVPIAMAIVPKEEATLLRKIKTITKSGNNVQVKRDKSGKLRVFKVLEVIT